MLLLLLLLLLLCYVVVVIYYECQGCDDCNELYIDLNIVEVGIELVVLTHEVIECPHLQKIYFVNCVVSLKLYFFPVETGLLPRFNLWIVQKKS